MTPQQEQKLNEVHDCVIRMEGRMNLFDERQLQHREAILEQERLIADKDKRLKVLEGDRNKVLGAMWVTCSSAFLGALAFIGAWFKTK